MKNVLTYLFIMLPILAWTQPTPEQIRQVEEAKKVVKKMKGEPFPDFSLTDIEGNVYTKEALEGKIILFNFWFTGCTPCVQEMPELNELVEEFGGEVVFLAPTFDSEDRINSFLRKRDFDYDIISDVKEFCLELNVRSYPTHFVVNREGTIEKVIIGYSVMTVGSLRKSIKKLLRSK